MMEPVWLAGARKLVGLKEIVGSKHEKQIVAFFAEAGNPGVKDDETAWCAAFVGAMLKKAGVKGTGKLNARSYLQWGVKIDQPRVGCIVVFKRGNSAWQGHVAFYLRTVGNRIEVLGGNQGNAVSIAQYPKSALLGYRWPADTVRPVQPDDPGEDDEAPVIVKKPLTPAQKGAGGVVGAGGAVIAAHEAGVPWGWIVGGLIVAGAVGFAAWYFRADLIRIFNKLKGN